MPIISKAVVEPRMERATAACLNTHNVHRNGGKHAHTSALPGFTELRLVISHTSCNHSPMTILLQWLVFLTSARPQAEVHLPCQNQPTAEIKTPKSLHSTAAPLIKCAECRVQFAKLQVFCTCKYTLITAIKEDYGRLADGECNVVLIRV